MERRSFMLGLLAVSAGAAGTAFASQAEASPIRSGTESLPQDQTVTLPDGTPVELAQYRGRRRRRRQVCRVRRNRYGRRVRVCRWVWS